MNLVLEVEYLTRVCRAASEPGEDSPDWPPQPDRVFSALVSSWAARGQRSEEKVALEWLEGQPPPEICASGFSARSAPECYVPPNDFRTPERVLDGLKWYRESLSRGLVPRGGQENAWRRVLGTLPENRRGQARRFPVARPDDPLVAFVWPQAPCETQFDALDALARDVGYLGHSASLVRCRFTRGPVELPHPPVRAQRRVYTGRLRELEETYLAEPERPVIRPGAAVPAEQPTEEGSQAEWLVLEAVEGDVPDIRATALVCGLLRRALMSGYARSGRPESVPEVVSGHQADGTPTRLPHLAIIPMPFVASAYSDGRVFGYSLIPPRGESLGRLRGFRTAFEAVAPYSASEQRRVLTLAGRPLRGSLGLSPVQGEGSSRRSLSCDPYLVESRVWASVTPMVMERHLKREGDDEVRELVAGACEHAGLPRPQPERIQVGKHSMVRGVPPAWPVAGQPRWTSWKRPASLSSRQLIHVVVDFGRNVEGPVLLGAGRFTGLGLCRGMGR